MSDITKVRSICQDVALYATQELEVDGKNTTYQLKYFPVLSSSVIITDSDDDPVTTGFTVDSEAGLVVFALAPESESLNVKYKHTLLTDEALQVFLDLNGSDLRLAAADALDAIASSQALIQKKIRTLDLQTDGPALAEALRAHAKQLREQVAIDDGDGSFDIAEMVYDNAGWMERVLKDMQRSGW